MVQEAMIIVIVKNTQTDESLTVNQFFFNEYNQFDKILFNDEIKKEDILWQSDKDDMLAVLVDTEETLSIKNWFKDENNRIDEIIFSDGKIFSADDLDQCFQNSDSIVSGNYCGVALQKDSQIFAQNRF